MSYTTAVQERLPLGDLADFTRVWVTNTGQSYYHVSPKCKQLDERSQFRETTPQVYYEDTSLCPTCRQNRLTQVDR